MPQVITAAEGSGFINSSDFLKLRDQEQEGWFVTEAIYYVNKFGSLNAVI